MNPELNVTAYLNQLDRHPQGSIYDRLLATSVGGPMYTGGLPAMRGLEAQAHGFLGFQTGGPIPGARVPIIEPPKPPPDKWSDWPGIPKWIGPPSSKELPGGKTPYPYPGTRPDFPYHPEPVNPIHMLGPDGGPKGTDTIPAWLTPGEYVVSEGPAQANKPLLEAINSGENIAYQPSGPAPGPPGLQLSISGGAAGTPSLGGPPLPPSMATAPGIGPTKIGGAAYPEGYGPGFQVTGSGLVGLLESLPATAINYGISAAMAAGAAAAAASAGGEVMPSGAIYMEGGGGVAGGGGAGAGGAGDIAGSLISAAINIGMQELNRAIGYAGQVAGIGVSGLMETFLPAGASQLASSNWLTRWMGGIVGAHPALPNIAGMITSQASQALASQSVAPPSTTKEHGPAAGTRGGPFIGVNIENYNGARGEDRAGQDIARHQQAAWPVMPGAR